ncbi:Uncharacterised protein [Vibrio cholerae]|nr:Uncharacterised protein [Vibrio cholerae]CSI85944.1 Uncharacterised protein [Vibrio cholerae]
MTIAVEVFYPKTIRLEPWETISSRVQVELSQRFEITGTKLFDFHE